MEVGSPSETREAMRQNPALGALAMTYAALLLVMLVALVVL